MARKLWVIWAFLAIAVLLTPSMAVAAFPLDPSQLPDDASASPSRGGPRAPASSGRGNAAPRTRSAPPRSDAQRVSYHQRPGYSQNQRSSYNHAEAIDTPSRAVPAPTPDPHMQGDYAGSGSGQFDGDFGDYGYSDFDDGSCGDGCDGPFGMLGCGRGPIYVRGEYLLWSVKGDHTPALVTTSPDTATRVQAGILGQAGTSILSGDQNFNSNGRSGGRVVGGWWLGCTTRIEFEGFGLGKSTNTFNEMSNGSPILARPFNNVRTGAADALVIAYPNQLQGQVSVTSTSQFGGAGFHVIHNLCGQDYCDRSYRVDFLIGYRYLHLNDSLTINDSILSTSQTGAPPVGTTINNSDSFSTINNFNGLDLGLTSESRLNRWCFTAIGRLGIGGTSEKVTINGSTTTTTPAGSTSTSAGGLLTMPSNIGSFSNTGFAVVPAMELKLGYDISERCRFTVGYDAMYWSRVARPGGQIDPYINTSQASGGTLVGIAAPQFTFRETDVWVQGLSVGGELRF